MTTMATSDKGDAPGGPQAPPGGFQVHLDVFEGPFDLLLALISKHKLDITEIALSSVTDEFIAHIRALADAWDLDQASYFLVVAATLLDLKAARLLPAGEVDDEEDLALLEARDLLFARLLQYRAYKEVAAVLAGKMAVQGRALRAPGGHGAAVRQPAARGAARPRPRPVRRDRRAGAGPAPRRRPCRRTTCTSRGPACASRLRYWRCGCVTLRRATFRQLTADCAGTFEVVARFLAVLELFRDSRIALDQVVPLGDLYVSWSDPGPTADASQADEEDD